MNVVECPQCFLASAFILRIGELNGGAAQMWGLYVHVGNSRQECAVELLLEGVSHVLSGSVCSWQASWRPGLVCFQGLY